MTNSKKNRKSKGINVLDEKIKEGISVAESGFSLLNQGTFGCIYHPGMTCNHEPLDAKYVTKIHGSNEKTVENEIAISKKVQTIKSYEDYFSPILENCKVNLAKVNREEVEKCNFIKEDIKSKKPITYVSTKIRYIEGKSLMEYVAYQTVKIYPTISFLYKILCESVKKLTEKQIIHFDLRENNIIVSKQGIPIIIDFGISIDISKIVKTNTINANTINAKTNKLKDIFYAYTTKYKPWCIEIVLISYIVHHETDVTSDKIMEIFDEVMKNNDFENKPYLKEELPKYRENFKTSVSTIPPKELLEYLLSTYKQWDLYSVAILLIQMLEKTNQTPTKDHITQLKENLGFSF